MTNYRIKVAFGSVPKDGGTFTFYRNQRKALKKLGVDMYCVSIGPEQADLWEESYADENCVLLAPSVESVKGQAKIFVQWCQDERIDIVMAINSKAILSSLAHLPSHIKIVSRCANAFEHGYRITMSGGNRLSRIVALTPRLRNDLIESYGASESMITLIPNGIEDSMFKADRFQADRNALNIGFLGRLEHQQKGVMHIPPIMEELKKTGIPFHLKVAGKGKHRAELETELSKVLSKSEYEFLGALNPNEIPSFFSEQDVYLFTSHFEGCPNALLEAMMASVAPVSWIIKGITDFIIEDGKTGFLLETGDYQGMASSLAELQNDREALLKIRTNAAAEARARFTTEICAQEYQKLFKQVIQEPSKKVEVLSWNDFKIDPNFGREKLYWLPYQWRKRIKQLVKG
ncbi:MAG: glycosyltransferase family 4 protein [Bacteroidia bacterium]